MLKVLAVENHGGTLLSCDIIIMRSCDDKRSISPHLHGLLLPSLVSSKCEKYRSDCCSIG